MPDHRSMVADHRSTATDHGQRRQTTLVIDGQWWQSTTVADGGPPLTTVEPPLTTVDHYQTIADHHQTTDQRWLIGRSVLVKGWVWIGSGPGRPRGMPRWESNPVPLAQRLKGYPKRQLS
nr:hypothetical protein [Tanacetum cinerariifolium]